MKLEKIDKSEYGKYADLKCSPSATYPMSIIEDMQKGDIYESDGAVLLWHYCGFAYIAGNVSEDSGNVSEEFLDAVYTDFIMAELSRRFVLITDDKFIIDYLSAKPGIETEKRYEFEHDMKSGSEIAREAEERNSDIKIVPVTEENIDKIKGRIIPAFSWDSNAAFLEKGLGYVAVDDSRDAVDGSRDGVDGSRIAAVAFSSAVSSEEIDIGVETNPDYRNRGLAAGVAGKMCEAVLALGKKPIWSCSSFNLASSKTAEKVGFERVREKTVIRKK